MTAIFDLVMLICAAEDSRYGSVSVLSLAALVAAGLSSVRIVGYGPVENGIHLLRGLLLALPFAYFAYAGKGGSADVLGVFAIGLRFPVPRALAVVTLACAAGALSLVWKTEADGTIPFFPCLALATIVLGGSV